MYLQQKSKKLMLEWSKFRLLVSSALILNIFRDKFFYKKYSQKSTDFDGIKIIKSFEFSFPALMQPGNFGGCL